jgi:hypothetical protein
MNYSDILALLEQSQAPSDWVRVDNENRDGGNTSFCVRDVLLTISFGVVWVKGKPFASITIKYGPTILGWVEFPLASVSTMPSFIEVLLLAKKHLSAAADQQ